MLSRFQNARLLPHKSQPWFIRGKNLWTANCPRDRPYVHDSSITSHNSAQYNIRVVAAERTIWLYRHPFGMKLWKEEEETTVAVWRKRKCMADSRVPGDLTCMKLRPNELCGRRALFDSMTNQTRLIDQTYLPRNKAATTGTSATLFTNCSLVPSNYARDHYQSCSFNANSLNLLPGREEWFRQI